MGFTPNGQVHLTADQVAVACTIATAPGHELLERPDARRALAGLRSAGAVDEDGALSGPTAAIIRVIARAEVRLEWRTWRAGGAVREQRAWVDERAAVVGDVRAGGVDLTCMPSSRLPLAVALRLGLGGDRARVRAPREAIAATPVALLAARSRVEAGDLPAARAALLQRGVNPSQAYAVLALALDLRVAWSVASSWREPSGELHTGVLSAADAGPAGWWELRQSGDVESLQPTDPEALWAALHGLLPDGTIPPEATASSDGKPLAGRSHG